MFIYNRKQESYCFEMILPDGTEISKTNCKFNQIDKINFDENSKFDPFFKYFTQVYEKELLAKVPPDNLKFDLIIYQYKFKKLDKIYNFKKCYITEFNFSELDFSLTSPTVIEFQFLSQKPEIQDFYEPETDFALDI
jgi:hypothetical protein